MKKATPCRAPLSPAIRLDAVAAGIRAQIVDFGAPTQQAESDSDIRAQIVDFG